MVDFQVILLRDHSLRDFYTRAICLFPLSFLFIVEISSAQKYIYVYIYMHRFLLGFGLKQTLSKVLALQ